MCYSTPKKSNNSLVFLGVDQLLLTHVISDELILRQIRNFSVKFGRIHTRTAPYIIYITLEKNNVS